MMWVHEEEELQRFLEALNCFNPNIQFKTEYSGGKKHFLDVTVMKKCKKLITD